MFISSLPHPEYNLFVSGMFNLNIVLGLLYSVLVGCEMLVVKGLLRARMEQFRRLVARHEKKKIGEVNR